MCCGSKKSVDATVPPRPVRRLHPSCSQSYDEPDIYPERSWHTQSQEDWTGVYGPDFDMMKKELTSAGKWEQMKNEGKWEYMAGEMAWTMVKLGNKELIDKWTKLEKQAKKNREREQTRHDEHRRRTGRDREYLRGYYAQARKENAAKKARLEKEAAKKKAAEEAKKLKEAKKAEVAKVRAIAKQLARARAVQYQETVARIPYQTDNQKAKKKAAEAPKKLEKAKKLEDAKKAALAKKGRLQRRTV
jgi:hypothetical protein